MRVPKLFPALLLLALPLATAAQQTGPRRDLTKEPTLYVVGYAHLDTEWRWEYPQTIREYIPKTMRENFALFEKYPNYVFNFSGANRYRMMKEYFPKDYARVQQYVQQGRWFPAGSAMEESDVNVPSAESLVRQILYGSDFFRTELGRSSAEYMLPDCFGFPASLPSILAHAGVRGFSTQKLGWGSAVGIPFNVGFWEGPDGRGVIAALNPGDYTGSVRENLATSARWLERINGNGARGGVLADYLYHGTGDTGGSPSDSSVSWVERSMATSGAVRVIGGTAEQLFLDIGDDRVPSLPRYRGDLLLREHSAGSITSQAYMKRWNRMNENLADAAERAAVAAAWLGARDYPLARLNGAWTLVMSGQFHDILPGTSTPKAYEYAWNDQVLAMNQFAGVLESSVSGVADALDTNVRGTPVIVFNALSVAREDLVEADVAFSTPPKAVRVRAPDGRDVPAQLTANGRVLFLARVPATGFAVYDVSPADEPMRSALRADGRTLENDRYRVTLNDAGDIASVFDKALARELLRAPARLALQYHNPSYWPAWNMDWVDQQRPPRTHVGGPANIRVVEQGAARVAIEVLRAGDGSRFLQTISLAAGDAGQRVEIDNRIDWRTAETALKQTFPLTATNAVATYNWDVGAIQRPNNDSMKYEVPSHQWFDLTDRTGAFGVTILSGAKYGSDKPADDLLRLTLLYSPGLRSRAYVDQGTQDWGHHEIRYGIAAHAGDWRAGETDWQAWRLDQPLFAFTAPRHSGALGRTFSLFATSSSRVRVLAVKRAEHSDEIVVRLVELDGRPQADVRVTFARPLVRARELDGQEREIGSATVNGRGELTFDLTPWQLRTFAVSLGGAPARVAAPQTRTLELPLDISVTSADSMPPLIGMDSALRTLPAELFPRTLRYGAVPFRLGEANRNALAADGQEIRLPGGAYNRVYLLVAADREQSATFLIGGRATQVRVPDWTGYVGQWDNRIWEQVETSPTAADSTRYLQRLAQYDSARARGDTTVRRPTLPQPRRENRYAGLTPGFIDRTPVAWFASHHHDRAGANRPYEYSYLYVLAFDVPAGARVLKLPANRAIKVFAATAAAERGGARAAAPLYDVLGGNSGRPVLGN